MRHMLSCIVHNRPGVLAEVARAMAERHINIHSLAVNESEGESVSRLTIVIEAERDQFDAIARDTARIENVVRIEDLDRSGFLDRELVLAKIDLNAHELPSLMQVLEVMHASVVAIDQRTMTVEMTGTEEKISGFIRLLKPFGIREYARSGRVAVSAGDPT
jgi:acetolactate synthase I/III small subunit